MAKVLRQGKTPFWGTFTSSSPDDGGLLIDSFNITTEVKDYEQQNELGAIKGYLVYDQTIGFDISGTMMWSRGDSLANCFSVGLNEQWDNPFKVGKRAAADCAASYMGAAVQYMTAWEVYNCSINNPSTAIVKNNSFSTSAGGAATFSASGTIYDFT